MTDSRYSTGTERAHLAKLVYEAMRFSIWAAGQGFMVDRGEPASDPEDFLFDYSKAMDVDDWDGLAEVARDFVSGASHAQAAPDTRCQNCTPVNCAYMAGGYGKCQPTQGGDQGEAVAWIAFAANGNIRFWTSDPNRSQREQKRGLDLRAFTMAELIALVSRLPAPQPASNATIPDDLLERLDDQGLYSKAERIQMIDDAATEIRRLRGNAESTIQNLRQQITDLQRTVVDANERYQAIAYAAKEPADAEAVAKAMYDWQFGAGTWDASQSSMKDHYVGLARAAISSLSSTEGK